MVFTSFPQISIIVTYLPCLSFECKIRKEQSTTCSQAKVYITKEIITLNIKILNLEAKQFEHDRNKLMGDRNVEQMHATVWLYVYLSINQSIIPIYTC